MWEWPGDEGEARVRSALAHYEGPLAEFLTFLRAAAWTGVGRQTVWGKGEVEVAPPG